MRVKTVRRAHSNDAQAIARVHVLSWREAYRGLIPDEIIDQKTVASRTPQWSAWIADCTRAVFAGEDESGEIVGLSMCRPYHDEPGFDVQLSALYILQKAQGAGLGRRLLVAAAAEFAALGFSALTLNVIAANFNARCFYEHLGAEFVREAKMHDADQSWIDAVYGWRHIRSLIADARGETS